MKLKHSESDKIEEAQEYQKSDLKLSANCHLTRVTKIYSHVPTCAKNNRSKKMLLNKKSCSKRKRKLSKVDHEIIDLIRGENDGIVLISLLLYRKPNNSLKLWRIFIVRAG